MSGPALSAPPNDISPTLQVRQSNNATAAWLITCPQQPQGVSLDSPQYFGSYAVPYVAGDACLAPSTPLATTAFLSIIATPSTTAGQLPTVTPILSFSNLANVVIENLGYSPMVDNAISDRYATIQNIFDGQYAMNQQGIWAWYAKYADLSGMPSLSTPPVTVSGLTYNSPQSKTVTFTEGKTTYTTKYSYTCTYPYSVTVSASVSNIRNAQIPFYYSSGGTEGSFQANVLPYFLYGYNLSVPSAPTNVNLNMTYGIYGPLTYNDPQNNIDPFPINTTSYFFAGQNGKLTPFEYSPYYPGLALSQSFQTSTIHSTQGLTTLSSSPGTTGYGYPVGSPPSGSPCSIERTDQGKDWGGSCPLYAIGAGTIVNLKNAGWPGGIFIALKLDNPPDPQHSMVYYAEDISPSVSIGQQVAACQVIGMATGGSSGIEIGWASPTSIGESLNTQLYGKYKGYGSTPEGSNFVNFISGLQQCGSGGPLSSSAASSGAAGAATGTELGNPPTAACPDTASAGTLNFQQVYACAYDAGFRGVQLAIIVSISWYESSFNSQDASGLLGGSSSADHQGSNPAYWYSPSTCSTPSDWWQNPTCQFNWAYNETEAYSHDGPVNDPSLCSNGPDTGYKGLSPPAGPHVFCYWGTYRNEQPQGGTGPADYCGAMPSSYSGENCPAGAAGTQTVGITQADWASVGLSNPGTGYGVLGAPTSATEPFTINAISIATSPNNYMYILSNSVPASPPGVPVSPVAIPFPAQYFNNGNFLACFHGSLVPYPDSVSCSAAAPSATGDNMGNAYTMPVGTPVYAMFSGTLTWENDPGTGYGLRAFLTLPNGWVIAYGNLYSLMPNIQSQGNTQLLCYVPPGSSSTTCGTAYASNKGVPVTAGEQIGYAGAEPGSPSGSAEGELEIQLLTTTTPKYSSVYGSSTNYQSTCEYCNIVDLTPGGVVPVPYNAVDPRALLLSAFGKYSTSGGVKGASAVIANADGCSIWNDEFSTSSSTSRDHGFQMPATYEYYPLCPNGYAPGGAASSGYYLYILRAIPPGFASSSNFAPVTVQTNQPAATWDQSWQNYWSQLQSFQSAGAYVVNEIPINLNEIQGLTDIPGVTITGSLGPASVSASTCKDYNNPPYVPTPQVGMTYVKQFGFVPINISVDNNNNVYIIGQFEFGACGVTADYPGGTSGSPSKGVQLFSGNYKMNSYPQYGLTGLVRVSNTLGTPVLTGSYVPVTYPEDGQIVNHPSQSGPWSSSEGNPGSNGNHGSVSREGAFTEIAVSPDGSAVYLASPYQGNIVVFNGQTLQYSITYNLAFGDYAGGPSTSLPVANLSIDNWLVYGGLFGIGAKPIPGYPQLAPASSYTQNSRMSQFLDTAPNSISDDGAFVDYGNGYDRNLYHHPLAITDVNGYLYVLDNWNDGQDLMGQISGTFGAKAGLFFQIIDLRVLNISGTDVPINPATFNTLINVPSNANNGCTATYGGNQPNGPASTCIMQPYSDANVVAFPPYGWILSANISRESGASNPGIKTPVTFCGSSACTFNPSNLPSNILYPPIGPQVVNYPGNQNPMPKNYKFDIISPIGFSTTQDNYLSLWFPPSRGQRSSTTSAELILAYLNPENYTSYSPTMPFYTCYTNNGRMNGANNGASCTSWPSVPDLQPPISQIINPFHDLESVGSFRSVSLQGIIGSEAAGAGSGSGQLSGSCSTTTVAGASPPTSPPTIGSCSTQAFSTATSTSAPTSPLSLNGFGSTTLNSVISGYLVVPYSYSLSSSVQYNPSPGQITSITSTTSPTFIGPVPPPTCPSPSSLNVFNPISSPQSTYYSYAVVPATSNPYVANVQSGSTYLQYGNGTLYTPTLSNVIMPLAVQFSTLTNRIFGSVWLNVTPTATTNNQVTVNAIRWLQYRTGTFMLNGQTAYQSIYSSNAPPLPLAGPGYAPLELSNQGQTAMSFNNLFSYNTITGMSGINLFDWYEGFIYANPTSFLAGSDTFKYKLPPSASTATANTLGYHRLVYAFNDKFNNTIYAPIDADIARISQISLIVNPVPQTGTGTVENANQTTLYMNGTAGFTDVEGQFTPINSITAPGDNYVYLYYNTNINYMDNKTGNAYLPANAVQDTLCAFSTNPSDLKDCAIADPSTGISKQDIAANVVNYAPSYNSLNKALYTSSPVCNPPQNSLLAPPLFNCNIYNKAIGLNGTPISITNGKTPGGNAWYGSSCPARPSRVGSAVSNIQTYCIPLNNYGTGVCSSQVGLIARVPTNSVGGYSFNTVACGAGSATISAEYYGYPPPEPINAIQNKLPSASSPVSVQDTKFKVYNYYWTQNVTSQSTQIGLLLLSYGNITAVALAAAVAVAMAIVAAMRRSGSRGKRKGRAER